MLPLSRRWVVARFMLQAELCVRRKLIVECYLLQKGLDVAERVEQGSFCMLGMILGFHLKYMFALCRQRIYI